jgi:hypothetical protein
MDHELETNAHKSKYRHVSYIITRILDKIRRQLIQML